MNETRRKRWPWVVGAGLVALLVGGLVAARPVVAQNGPLAWLPAELADRPVVRLIRQQAPKVRELFQQVNLTPDQRAGIKSVLKAHETEIKALARRLKAHHRKVSDLTLATPIDEPAIREAVADAVDDAGEAAVLKARIIHEIMPLLTPGQLLQLGAFREQLNAAIDALLVEGAR